MNIFNNISLKLRLLNPLSQYFLQKKLSIYPVLRQLILWQNEYFSPFHFEKIQKPVNFA